MQIAPTKNEETSSKLNRFSVDFQVNVVWKEVLTQKVDPVTLVGVVGGVVRVVVRAGSCCHPICQCHYCTG